MRTRVLTLALVALFLTGCFGTFPVTRKVHEVNTNVSENVVVQQVTFLGMSPLYLLGPVLDLTLFNSLEWWVGQGWVDPDSHSHDHEHDEGPPR